jgi:hypothetical protein
MIMNSTVFWDVTYDLVIADVSEEGTTSVFKIKPRK